MNTRLRNGIFWLLLILLLAMPFATLVVQTVKFAFEQGGHPLSNGLVKLLTGWKELFLAVSLLGFVAIWIKERAFPFVIAKFDLVVVLFMAFGVLWGGHQAHSLSSTVYGFRYDFSVFLYYFVARALIVDREQFVGILKKMIWVSIPVLSFGCLQTFALPRDLLSHIGYSMTVSVTGNPLPPYHLILGDVVRAMSTFPGPNSLAFYAVLIFFMVYFLGREQLGKVAWYGVGGLSLLTLLLTFSRGHFLSLVCSFLLIGSFALLSRPKRVLFDKARRGSYFLTAGTIILLVVSFWGLLQAGQVQRSHVPSALTFFLHDDSTAIHRDLRLEAWDIIKTHSGGTGLGTSGLATTNTGGVVFNPESWYVQITQELGWLGIFAAMVTIGFAFSVLATMYCHLSDQMDRRLVLFLLCGFTATLLSANFLPSWFEVASISWWILFGFFLSDYLRSFPRSEVVLKSQPKA